MDERNVEYLEDAREAIALHKYPHALNSAEILLARLEDSTDFEQMGLDAFETAGDAALGMSEFALAEEYYGRAITMIDEALDPLRVQRCQLSLAECHLRHGNLRQARHLINIVVNSTVVQQDAELYTRALSQLGTVSWVEGELDSAIEYLERAIKLCPAKARDELRSRARSSLGIAYSKAGRLVDAEGEFTAAMERFQAVEDYTQVVRCLNNLAGIAFQRRDWNRAREYLLDCVQLETETRNRSDLAYSWYNLGLIELHEGDYKLARKYLNRSFQLSQEVNDRSTEASSLLQLGIVALLDCQAEQAINYIELAQGRMEGSPSALATTLNWYASLVHLANSEVSLAEEVWAARTELADAETIHSLVEIGEFIVTERFSTIAEITPQALTLAHQYLAEIRRLVVGQADELPEVTVQEVPDYLD